MPQIRQFTAPEGLGLQPTEIGVHATEAAARRVGAQYSEIAQLKKEAGRDIGAGIAFAGQQATEWLERKEISQGAAAFAGLMNSKTKQWQETNTNADPNDPTVAKNFQDSVAADLDKFRSGFLTRAGQQWAEAHAQKLEQHFFHKSTADRANAAGHAVKLNAARTVEGLANAAMWDGGTEVGLRTALSTLETSALPKDVIEEGKKTIIARAAHGYIQTNAALPDWVKKEEYRGYVDARVLKQMEVAERTERADRARAAKVDQQTEIFNAKKGFNDEANKFERDTLPVNNEARPQLPPDAMDRLRQLRDHPGAQYEPGRYRDLVRHAETIAERLNKPEPLATVSHRNVMGLVGRIRSGEITSVAQIDDYYQPTANNPNGLLTTADYNFARKEFVERRTDEGVTISRARGDFWKRYERSIDAAMTALGERSALGDQQIHKANLAAREQEEQLRRAGKDPHLVYDERSEFFFGRPENLRNFAVSLQQIQDYNAAIRKGEPAAVPGAPAPAPVITGPGVTKTTRSFMDLPENVPTQAPNRSWYVRRGDQLFPSQPPPSVPVSR